MPRLAALALLVAFCPAVLNAAGPDLDAKLAVKVASDLAITCHFDLPGTKDQKFDNSEYRFKVLDADPNEVQGALAILAILRTVDLPKFKRSVTDGTGVGIRKDKLTSGQTYFFVVKVRNLVAINSFTAP